MSAAPATRDSLPWYSAGKTATGHVRRLNEDAFLDVREQGLWAVADGMGGHSRGDWASQCIVETLHDFKRLDNPDASIEELMRRLEQANRLCLAESGDRIMGSTVAALYLHDDKAYTLWAGDSRIYRFRGEAFSQLTDDHSLVQELHRLGELTRDEADSHPSQNVITRAIGVAEELEVQVRQFDLEAGDRFILCSDGLFKDMKPAELRELAGLPSPRDALDRLMELALKRGGTDNLTAVVVQVA